MKPEGTRLFPKDYFPELGNCRGCFSTGPLGAFCSKCYSAGNINGQQNNNDMFVLYRTNNERSIWKADKLEEAMNQSKDPYPLVPGFNLSGDGREIIWDKPVVSNKRKSGKAWVVYKMNIMVGQEIKFFEGKGPGAGEMFWITHYQH